MCFEAFDLGLLRLHFLFTPRAPLRLDGFVGSTWHGALGHALSRISGDAFSVFFEESSTVGPRPFALCPVGDMSTHGVPATLGFALTLVGSAVRLAPQMVLAAELLAETGLGNRRVPLDLAGVAAERATGGLVPVLGGNGLLASDCLEAISTRALAEPWAGRIAQRVLLRFDTRLRLKASNGLVREAPHLGLLSQRLLERISALGALYGAGPLPDDVVKALLADAYGSELIRQELRWEEWTRTSGRSGQTMPWGGLVGELEYRGEVGDLLPWLALGQWLQVGSKTSFGLGHYALWAAPS